ncbi:hypothetical protein [Paracidovorax sp. MALMAid1276]|uniref:hypothetical protein n=1 Tax=Paracidovorax sp. MALMAid1276 TaxID=3411631 RepID=UPI003B9DBAA5
MPQNANVVGGVEFAAFAQRHFAHWAALANTAVRHTSYGNGVVTSVTEREGYVPLLAIRFTEHGAMTFNSESFLQGAFSEVVLNDELREPFLVWQAAETTRRQFQALAERYNIPPSLVRLSHLLPVLLKLEAREQLSEDELRWLKGEKLFNVLATYYRRAFLASGDPWHLVKACSSLRAAGMPRKAIEASEKYADAPLQGDQRAFGALLTSRGGAFRDVGNLDAARQSGLSAVETSPTSPHPHNLLGAVCYAAGHPADGDRHFDIAVSLGGNAKASDVEVRSVLQQSDAVVRMKITQYLLGKDRAKYAWVARYAGLHQET